MTSVWLRKFILVWGALPFFCQDACSEDFDIDINGHLEYQLTGSLAPPRSIQRSLESSTLHGQEIDARINVEARSGALQATVHGETLGSGGTELEFRNAFMNLTAPLRSDLDDERRLFDISKRSLDDQQFQLFNRLDRASVGYYGKKSVAKVGRQVYTLGNGLTFQVLDLLNPFSPIEIDKDYKTGEDFLYLEHLFNSGSSIEILTVPRRNELGNVSNSASSYGGVFQTSLPGLGSNIQLFAAEHFEELHLGFGSSTDVSESVLRADVMFARSDEQWIPSVVVNFDSSWTVWGKNAYTFIEYYRNGFGVADKSYTDADVQLLERRSRGELFVLGRDFLTLGGQLELNPLASLFINHIVHLNDGSGFHQFRFQYDLSQESLILLGANLPYGPKRTEFGGTEIVPEQFIRPARSIYARLSFFF